MSFLFRTRPLFPRRTRLVRTINFSEHFVPNAIVTIRPFSTPKAEAPSINKGSSKGFIGFALGLGTGLAVLGLWASSKTPPNLNTVPKYGTTQEMEKELRVLLGDDAVSIDDEDLKHHGYSEWSTINISTLPVAVTYPKSTSDVSTIAKICHKFKIPMIPFSGGSSVEGNFSAPFGGFSIDFCHMDSIVEHHLEDLNVVVQPSVSWITLNETLEKSGVFFPIDPGPSAKIGGMVGTNCSGTNAVRYGTMRDWVVNLTVVLADGSIIKTRRRPRKSSAGYNLNGIIVGSEGTLGIVTEITLKLAVIPEETSVAVVAFPNVRAAADAAVSIVQQGVPVQAVEILDDVLMKVINQVGGTSRVWKEQATLFFKFAGSKPEIIDQIKKVKRISAQSGGVDFEFAKSVEEQHELWSARKQALWSMLSLRTAGNEVWSTDVAVPLSRLADILEISKQEMDGLGLFGIMLGHVGDGNFHETILYDGTKPEERKAVEDCVHSMVKLAIDMEGTCTGEHSIGLGKKDFLQSELDPNTIGVMRGIKKSMDPHWLMNPGKIFDQNK